MALSIAQMARLWVQAGGPSKYAVAMAHIAERESGGRPDAQNLNAATRDHSIGLWQINQLAHHGRYGTDQQLKDPMTNARAAVALFNAERRAGVDPMEPWSTHDPAIDSKYIGAQAPIGAPLPKGGVSQRTTVTPGVDNSALRRSLIAQFVSQGGPDNTGALVNLASGLADAKDVPARTKTVTTPDSSSVSAGDTSGKGTATFDGKPVAGWIAPILAYARQHGWKGTVNSGYRSDAEQTRIYKSGVRPAALPISMGGHGSHHEFTAYPGGAVDVSDAATLSAIIARSPWRGKLVWAGSKDPVHFSHPTNNGGY